ncbi:hypothetical protein GNF76_04940 [Pseudomonas sp. CCM 7893]|uniref:Pilus assembly protein n=1 Tax=Pseudomonas spelaei TaxID=1055469 RepID=A0A6I3W0E4_9PSED|nr:hypothetical protein [Pseudomonas spelaei]MUF03667.1 hypothetical protein [Pseudomonas spelaei]
MRLSVLSALLLLPYLVVPAPAFALIDISPKEIVVQGKPATVQIINNGERPEYVSITLSRLLNPGVEGSSERLEPITLASKPILYAFPFRITLAPGQSKTITLKPLEEVQREQVYRLDVTPVISLKETEHRASSGNVLINLSFSGLVRQLPYAEKSRLAVTCEGSGALLAASGNVRYPVKGAKVDGSTVDPFNVYPGEPKLLKGKSISIPGQPSC